MVTGKFDMSVKTSFHLHFALLLQQLSCQLFFLKHCQPPSVNAFRPPVSKPGAREVQHCCLLSEHLSYHSRSWYPQKFPVLGWDPKQRHIADIYIALLDMEAKVFPSGDNTIHSTESLWCSAVKMVIGH